MRAPYKLLFKGFEVIRHVPDEQPTNFQYKKPPIPPAIVPATYSQFLLNHCCTIYIIYRRLFRFEPIKKVDIGFNLQKGTIRIVFR